MAIKLPTFKSSAAIRTGIVAGTILIALVTGGALMHRGARTGTFTVSAGTRLFESVFRHIQNDYVDQMTDSVSSAQSVEGMLFERNDPHSACLPPERFPRLHETPSGSYAGHGIDVVLRDGALIGVAPIAGGPAERAGVQPGDRIVEIMGKPTRGWTNEEASRVLRGKAGTPVKLTVERPGVDFPIKLTLSRTMIHQSAVRRSSMLTDGVGYIDLKAFSDSTAQEVVGAISSLLSKGMKTLVLDLRTNPGGLLNQGVRVSDLFLNPGQKIVSMRGRLPEANREYADTLPQRWPKLPLIVLVDRKSVV